MLVLSRKAGQRVHIGDDIVVEIRRVAGNRVTIALEAPRDVRILRGELHESATDFDDDEVETYSVTQVLGPRFSELTTHMAASEMVG